MAEEELFVLDVDTSTEGVEEVKPKYDVDHSLVVEESDGSFEESKEELNTTTCWNCGKSGHSIRECKGQMDYEMIAKRRKLFMNNKPSGSLSKRYHDDKFSRFRAGYVSRALREALGLRRNEVPCFVYAMRVYGYPPGWLSEAKISSSGMNMYGDSGKRIPEPDEEEGEIVRKVMKYDVEKLIDFPGFNVPLREGCKDDCRKLGYPAMHSKHSKENFIKDLEELSSREVDEDATNSPERRWRNYDSDDDGPVRFDKKRQVLTTNRGFVVHVQTDSTNRTHITTPLDYPSMRTTIPGLIPTAGPSTIRGFRGGGSGVTGMLTQGMGVGGDSPPQVSSTSLCQPGNENNPTSSTSVSAGPSTRDGSPPVAGPSTPQGSPPLPASSSANEGNNVVASGSSPPSTSTDPQNMEDSSTQVHSTLSASKRAHPDSSSPSNVEEGEMDDQPSPVKKSKSDQPPDNSTGESDKCEQSGTSVEPNQSAEADQKMPPAEESHTDPVQGESIEADSKGDAGCDFNDDSIKDNESDAKNDSISGQSVDSPRRSALYGTPKTPSSSTYIVGTPSIKSHSPYMKLPSYQNFGKEISDVIDFENLPDSVGKYETLCGTVRKIREYMSTKNKKSSKS